MTSLAETAGVYPQCLSYSPVGPVPGPGHSSKAQAPAEALCPYCACWVCVLTVHPGSVPLLCILGLCPYCASWLGPLQTQRNSGWKVESDLQSLTGLY